jgi:hypothetical protein
MRHRKDHSDKSAVLSPNPSRTSAFPHAHVLSRRAALRTLGIAGLALAGAPAYADDVVKLPLPGDPRERTLTHDFPQKGRMILQRTRLPLLGTPMEVFDRSVFTPQRPVLCPLALGRDPELGRCEHVQAVRSRSRQSGSVVVD